MRILITVFLIGMCILANGQQTVYVKVLSKENDAPVIASLLIKGSAKGYSTDSNGIATLALPANGKYTIVISATGFEEKESILHIPQPTDTIDITLETSVHEMDEIIVQSTRTSRTIANVPTRVETIELEEIDEKSNMRPANVAMILHESTGIQVQQTSPTSANASIRIQGLDGRYTQLLKDGFANFGNFASGLSVLEIPPLDLRQVEIIKGPASTLYGGGAIAGVINFISKTPGDKPEYNFIVNQSNIGQTNIGGFAALKSGKLGFTMLALYSRQKAYDVDKDEFTEVPESNEVTFHPKLFIYSGSKTTITLGHSFTSGKRTGGDIVVINDKPDASHQYFEKNITHRNISTFELDKKISDRKRLTIKQSFGVFDRSINMSSYVFLGTDHNAYTDVSHVTTGPKNALVLGANFIYNNFKERSAEQRDNTLKTAGVYGQHTWDASDNIKLESGIRVDGVHYNNAIYSRTEFFVLPRLSLLVKYGPKWSSRIGGGMGYKTPTLFTEETETIQFQNVDQLQNVKSEKSYGGTADVNFKTLIGNNLSLSFNHMFFYTWIQNPLVLQNYTATRYRFFNALKPLISKGFEANTKLIYRENFKLFLGYTFTHSRKKYLAGNQVLPLVPKHKLNTALIYEKEDKIKIGLEGYFTGAQYLSNGTKTPVFSEFGFMTEKIFNRFSLYINFENFTDTRQSRYKNVVNGSHLNPSFDEIWTHTEGFVVNGGIKLRF